MVTQADAEVAQREAIREFRFRTGRYGYTIPFLTIALSRAFDIDPEKAFHMVKRTPHQWHYCGDVDTYVSFEYGGLYSSTISESGNHTPIVRKAEALMSVVLDGKYSKLHRRREWVGDENRYSKRMLDKAIAAMRMALATGNEDGIHGVA